LLRSLIETNHRLKALLLGEAIVLLAHAELFERLAAAKGLRDERMVVVEYFKYVLDYCVLWFVCLMIVVFIVEIDEKLLIFQKTTFYSLLFGLLDSSIAYWQDTLYLKLSQTFP
jgi:hypothetical protein